MHQHHHRQVLLFFQAVRQRQPSRDLQPVARLDAHHVHAGHVLGHDVRALPAEPGEFARLPVEKEEQARLDVGKGLDQHPGRLPRPGQRQPVHRARQHLVDLRLQRRHVRVQPLGHLGVDGEAQAQDLVGAGEHLRIHIEQRRLCQRLGGPLARRGIHQPHCLPVAAALRGDIELATGVDMTHLEVALAGVDIELAERAPLLGLRVAPQQRAFLGLPGHRHAQIALRISGPGDGVHGPLNELRAAGPGVQAQQLDEPHVLAVVGFGACDQHLIPLAQSVATEKKCVPWRQLEVVGGAHETVLPLDQLPERRAVVVDRKQAGCRIQLALRRVAISEIERQALVVDPDDVADIGFIGAIHDGRGHAAQFEHGQHRAPVLGQRAHCQSRAVRGQRRAQHLRGGHETGGVCLVRSSLHRCGGH